MTNADEFLQYYNLIDNHLKKSTGLDSYVSFSERIKKSANPVVKQSLAELISLGELRNAIVHSPKINNTEVIAEPHPQTVERIKKLHKQITQPKKVISEFKIAVIGAKGVDPIKDILHKMREKSFSQFPVFDANDHVCEVISTNTIARWISSNFSNDGTLLLDNVKVEDLIPEIEHKNNYRFIDRNASIHDAYDIFIKQINKGWNLDAIFITHSGSSAESLLGLITIEDIANKVLQ